MGMGHVVPTARLACNLGAWRPVRQPRLQLSSSEHCAAVASNNVGALLRACPLASQSPKHGTAPCLHWFVEGQGGRVDAFLHVKSCQGPPTRTRATWCSQPASLLISVLGVREATTVATLFIRALRSRCVEQSGRIACARVYWHLSPPSTEHFPM